MNFLKEKRKEMNLTQKQIAEKLGITSQAYGHYESLKRSIPIVYIVTLADVLQIGVEELIISLSELYAKCFV